MDSLTTLEYGLEELRRVVATLDDSNMDSASNCEPWTVRQLASHAMNNQLLWAGLVAGQPTVSFEDTMSAVPTEGDLAPVAADVAARAMAMWRTGGVLESIHATPLGELPGSVVVYFAIIDAVAHAWDLSASVGRPIEFCAAGNSVDHRGGRGDVYRRGSRPRPHQSSHPTARRRDRDRTVDGRGRPIHPPLARRRGCGADQRLPHAL